MTTSRDPLDSYRAKRDAARTPEPEGRPEARTSTPGALRFVVHKHAARRLHWDLRLEFNGVLWSWAVPNGPSRDPAEKRLAVHTEDHPFEYIDFEDVIPEGNYGAGAMIVWDAGTYTPLHEMEDGLAKGKLLFELRGHKLRGVWTLVKLKKAEEDAWLFMKERDAMSVAGPDAFAEDSIVSGLTVEELGSGDDPADPIRAELARLKAPIRLLDPATTELMLAESSRGAFSRADWLFEFKYDGYRALVFREDDDVRLLSRRGNDFASAFPDLVNAVMRLPYRRFLMDGEIVVEDESGLPSFQRLQQRARLSRAPDIRRAQVSLPARLWLFDLLGFEDWDVRTMPLTERKALLRRLLPSTGTIRFSDHIEQHGEALYKQAVSLGLEGVIGKKASGPYRSGRSGEWLKVRALKTDEFVIVGWTAAKGGRPGFGALHLAQHEDGELRWMGQVGTGFTDRQLGDLLRRMHDARVEKPMCVGAPEGRGHGWTRPEMVCEVRYLERTDDGMLRQPAFLRMRPDKAPEECISPGDGAGAGGALFGELAEVSSRNLPEAGLGSLDDMEPCDATDLGSAAWTAEQEAEEGLRLQETRAPLGEGYLNGDVGVEARPGKSETASRGTAAKPLARVVNFTNLDKILWPEDGYTKGDLIAYYRAISSWVLPYLRDRPIVLTRFPDGINGKSFFQKDAPSFAPKWLRTVTVKEDEVVRNPSYFVCDDEETLLYLANSASIPLHVWSSRVAALERPDWCILDLDPKDAPFSDVIEVAQTAKALCDEIGLPLYAKTSGSSGIHLLVPLGTLLDHDQTKAFGELLARVLVRGLQNIATITRQIERRAGKVYIDYLQNGRGKLLVAPFCVRALPGAPVSTPLDWSEVEQGLDIRRFTIRSVPPRVRAMKSDPLLPVVSETPDLLAALEALQTRV